MAKVKNLLGKSRNVQTPYAIFRGNGPFGETEVRLLKTYQKPANEAKNRCAKWLCATKTAFTHGSYDMGDSYIDAATYGLTLTYASDEYKAQYSQTDVQ